jgi:pilus assembly protein CpaC
VYVPSDARFLTVLTDFGTNNLLALIEAEEQRGNAKVLAEPNLMAGNKEVATFLAGGELPIPIVQGAGDGGNRFVTIQYREFGVRLRFIGEIVSDSLVKLTVTPEVSTLDYTNAVVLSGVRVPALRTRRVESTLDVRRDESLVISGMFNSEEEKVRTGIPILKDLPILGVLFSSTRFQRNESELLVIVRPVVLDPMALRAIDTVRTMPDTVLPAGDQIERRKRVPEKRGNWWQRLFGRSSKQEK